MIKFQLSWYHEFLHSFPPIVSVIPQGKNGTLLKNKRNKHVQLVSKENVERCNGYRKLLFLSNVKNKFMNKLKMTFFAKDPSFTRNLAFYIFTATGNK